MDYFIALGGVQQGPFPIDQLIGRGLKCDTLVWRSGMAQWQRADSVAELQSLFSSSAVPPPPPPRPEYAAGQYSAGSAPAIPVRSKRVLAGVLALFFGGLGIHKFALGMVGTGLIMLFTSVCISFLTFGFGYFVMHAVGFVEGIIYLSKSDQEFNQTYVVERRNWF
jgi:TM2 domain-containing membrane protein YozV